jgi:hypothetical protein
MELKLIALTAASFGAVIAGGLLFMPETGRGAEDQGTSSIVLDATNGILDPTGGTAITASAPPATGGWDDDDDDRRGGYDDDDDDRHGGDDDDDRHGEDDDDEGDDD